MNETIQIDDKKVLMKRYKLRRVGARKATIAITLPKEVVEREARRLGIREKEADKKLWGVWKYNDFHGVHLSFLLIEEEKETTP